MSAISWLAFAALHVPEAAAGSAGSARDAAKAVALTMLTATLGRLLRGPPPVGLTKRGARRNRRLRLGVAMQDTVLPRFRDV